MPISYDTIEDEQNKNKTKQKKHLLFSNNKNNICDMTASPVYVVNVLFKLIIATTSYKNARQEYFHLKWELPGLKFLLT